MARNMLEVLLSGEPATDADIERMADHFRGICHDCTSLRSRVEALESVVREAIELMDAYWESDSRSDAESVIRDRLLIDWHATATLLLAPPANEGTPERKGGE